MAFTYIQKIFKSQLNTTKNNAISINQTLTDNITKGEEVNVSLLNNTSAGTNLSSTLETQITTGNNTDFLPIKMNLNLIKPLNITTRY